jgi:hypothetical protein
LLETEEMGEVVVALGTLKVTVVTAVMAGRRVDSSR